MEPMTNEEKAEQLINTGLICSGEWECYPKQKPDCVKCNKYYFMLMIAQWKDEQFKKINLNDITDGK